MHLTYRNVNTAFADLVSKIHTGQIPTTKKESRNGNVLMIEEPVIITYEKPKERVLFNTDRDANPFFHLFESLWMLAGRNDVAPLSYYNSKIADFSDDGKVFNGAYGWRWRNWKIPQRVSHGKDQWDVVDQLQRIIQYLKDDPNGRRAVLEMWSVHSDLNRIGIFCKNCEGTGQEIFLKLPEDPRPRGITQTCLKCDGVGQTNYSKDVCCNTHVYFSIRTVTENVSGNSPFASSGRYETDGVIEKSYLDMTVCNRSNDMILGMLGANQVHFSFLQEYIANSLGIEVGVYNQMTNNLHVYEDNWKPMEWSGSCRTMHDPPEMSYDWIYENKPFEHIYFDVTKEELNRFVETYADGKTELPSGNWDSVFLYQVCIPMFHAFQCHKMRHYRDALEWMNQVESQDWKIAGINWITKRKQNLERKQSAAKASKD